MSAVNRRRIEFGDFQTPDVLADAVCRKLSEMGLAPDVVVEPTCGVGAFVLAAAKNFTGAHEVVGVEVNPGHLAELEKRVFSQHVGIDVRLVEADFFATDWRNLFAKVDGRLLVLGNFPWVTNAVQGVIGGGNLPEKSNFQNQRGFDAISGKANFDISEWMLQEIIRGLSGREADIAMLVKTAVARKILAYAERHGMAVSQASLFGIDAKRHFGAAVDACLMVIQLSGDIKKAVYDYSVFPSLDSAQGRRVGHREGLTVGDLEAFEKASYLLGDCPQKWRSGIKHDASAVMELSRDENGRLVNGFHQIVEIEADCLFPLLKGSDIGSDKNWREKFLIVTQHFVGQRTDMLRENLPKTWRYLESHAAILDARGSTIYRKNPRFSIFGVGDYAFRPWRIAICGLYKSLKFRLVGPIESKPVMFDDTVYYLSFDGEEDARQVLTLLNTEPARRLLSSLIFWDEKRPIKTGILNMLDWSRLDSRASGPQQLEMPFAQHIVPRAGPCH